MIDFWMGAIWTLMNVCLGAMLCLLWMALRRDTEPEPAVLTPARPDDPPPKIELRVWEEPAPPIDLKPMPVGWTDPADAAPIPPVYVSRGGLRVDCLQVGDVVYPFDPPFTTEQVGWYRVGIDDQGHAHMTYTGTEHPSLRE